MTCDIVPRSFLMMQLLVMTYDTNGFDSKLKAEYFFSFLLFKTQYYINAPVVYLQKDYIYV